MMNVIVSMSTLQFHLHLAGTMSFQSLISSCSTSMHLLPVSKAQTAFCSLLPFFAVKFGKPRRFSSQSCPKLALKPALFLPAPLPSRPALASCNPRTPNRQINIQYPSNSLRTRLLYPGDSSKPWNAKCRVANSGLQSDASFLGPIFPSSSLRLGHASAKGHSSAMPVTEIEESGPGKSTGEEGGWEAASTGARPPRAAEEGKGIGREGGRQSIEESTLEAALAGGGGPGLLAFYSDHQEVVLPDGHRFPMDKYRATRLVLEGDASLRGILTTYPSPMASVAELTLVHELDYVTKVMAGELSEKEQRATGFPWSPEMVRRSFASTGGTVAAMHAVMRGLRRAAGHIAGGTHHAFRGHGEGFCVFNDIAVASAVALREYPDRCHLAAPILVVDLDVHQGNGTAKIFEDDDRVITFSMHGANNYPWRTKMRSNYDVELQDKTGDEEYLSILGDWIPRLFEAHRPSLVFFQAGVDALREDSFGRLAMTRHGMLQRNNKVYSACLEKSVPLVLTMGGGYSRPNDASVLAHADVYRSAAYRYAAQYGLKPYTQFGNATI